MEKVEPQSWEKAKEVFGGQVYLILMLDAITDQQAPGHKILNVIDLVKLIETEVDILFSRREAEVRETPMGVSQWREHGKKYQYWDFFERRIREEIVKDYIRHLLEYQCDGKHLIDWLKAKTQAEVRDMKRWT